MFFWVEKNENIKTLSIGRVDEAKLRTRKNLDSLFLSLSDVERVLKNVGTSLVQLFAGSIALFQIN